MSTTTGTTAASTASSTVTASTTTTTPTTTTTGTTAAPKTVVDFTINGTTTAFQLQSEVTQYGGTVGNCTWMNDGSQMCPVTFDDASKANEAMTVANRGEMAGVSGAAAEGVPSPTTPNDPSSNTGLIVGVIIGVVVAGVIIAAVVWKVSSSSGGSRTVDDDDYANMNMALEDVTPSRTESV
eukprot:TRINITY_DN1442_c0_g1_i1.p2 TRINITY_DN1442_c0_g1~~TRINITY_DN1442_c0_g1_i1.p2  ORF type:complete len:182 (-),score=64.26 TRINITY_DN1442_c0_g1_i1:1014-1559(-)